MKILFWNIGTTEITSKGVKRDVKYDVLTTLVSEKKPEILCLAEGTQSIDRCKYLNRIMTEMGYIEYYSPLIPRNNPAFEFTWEPCGLKVYIKNSFENYHSFSPNFLLLKGRTIAVKFDYNMKKYCGLFIHAMSKESMPKKRQTFLYQLSEWYSFGGSLLNNDDNLFLIGDFNCEPWDEEVKGEGGYIENYIFKPEQVLAERKNRVKRAKTKRSVSFYSPIIKFLSNKNESTNLAGTRYDNKIGWSVIDYPMFMSNMEYSSFEIIQDTPGYEIMKEGDYKDDLLDYNFDHLPILIQL